MDGYKRLAAICCLMALLTFKDADTAVSDWVVPAIASGSTTVVAPTGAEKDNTATVMVIENAAAGYTVTTVSATGVGTVTFATTNTMFGVNPTSGKVFLHCSTLADAAANEYTVEIVASDADDTTTGTLTLTVKVNRAPVITGGRICICDIATGTASGTLLKTFVDTDANTDDTSTYNAIMGSNNGHWAISTQEFKTAAALNSTLTKCYDLGITVTDNGGGAGSGTAAAGSKTSVMVIMSISVGASGTTSSCSCSDGSSGNSTAASIVGSMVLLLAAGIAHFM